MIIVTYLFTNPLINQANQQVKGVLHLLPPILHVLYSISKLSTSFRKMIYASYSKFSKELKNSIKIKVNQAVLIELLIQTIF